MSFWRRLRPGEEEEAPPPVVRKPRDEAPGKGEADRASRAAEPHAAPEPSSRLGPGLRWQGQVSGRGRVHIDGTFEGVLEVEGEVFIGESGRVQAQRLEALTVVIAGVVQGPVKARKVVLRRTGRLHGDVLTEALEAESGGFLHGQVRMEERLTFPWERPTEAEAPPGPAPEEEPEEPSPATSPEG